jgi:formylglycine-generating enzyme required for sulfatase activity
MAAYPLSDAKAYQEDWARKLGVPVAVTGPAQIKLVFIPPGEFVMGTPDAEWRELRDKHGAGDNLERIEAERGQAVKIKQPFYLGATEVTIGQFKEFWDTRPNTKTHAERHRGFGRIKDANSARWELKAGYCWHTFGDHVFANDLPVFNVTWKEAGDFADWLTLQDNGKARYRLPTEAEWEYACRAGSVTPWSGATEKTLHDVAWVGWRADQQLKPVAGKLPNAFGLYDMHGNHSEWCGLAVGPLSHFPPLPPGAKDQRPVRGGSFHHPAERLRSAARAWFPPDEMGVGGFRVLKEIR